GLPGRAGLLRAQPSQDPARREGDQVHDSVPVDLERTVLAKGSNLERDCVEAGVLDHEGVILVIRASRGRKMISGTWFREWQGGLGGPGIDLPPRGTARNGWGAGGGA